MDQITLSTPVDQQTREFWSSFDAGSEIALHSQLSDGASGQLVQDINRQALVWYNVLETLKRSPTQRAGLKEDYELHLQLLPPNSLSNPIWPCDVDRAFAKLNKYSKGLLRIVRSYTQELLAELTIESGITATFQVQLMPPSLAIGIEKSLTIGASASKP